MLPHKHYAAHKIEQVVHKYEDSAAAPHECGAEESTLRRWIQEFPAKLSALAAHLESLTMISKPPFVPLLQRVYAALASLVKVPEEHCRLAWAFFVSKTHPLRL
jgi:hypothetical protein